ncbi:adenosine monophosphate-protein transferase [Candidatus Microgenomates bacterium]|nr:MAG: adenosine monophosphate-protein transferase [Candidatus Microgenomates bacterium]
MKTIVLTLKNPDAHNLIFGQSHFIKTVEDIHEALVNTVPDIQFGLAFCEASGPRLIRTSGTNEKLIKFAEKNAKAVGCGHTFFIFLENAFPINVLNNIKHVPEVVRIFAATANPLQIIVAETEQGRGVLGVVDGGSPLGIETEANKKERREFLRKIGYKL